MSEQSEKWDSQWSKLLTHSYGEVQADASFKSSLLAKLQQKTAENRSPESESDTTDDQNWSRLLTAAYVPCEPTTEFKGTLMSQLKARQAQLTKPERTADEEEALQTILTKTYHPVTPRREFQTRLLVNLKDRQRSNTEIRIKTRHRTMFMTSLTGMAAAALVMFAVWVSPTMNELTTPTGSSNAFAGRRGPDLPISDLVVPIEPAGIAMRELTSAPANESSFETVPASFGYKVAEAFAAAVLPATAIGLRNMEINSGAGWRAMNATEVAALQPGTKFRSANGSVGHLGFSDHSMVSMSGDAVAEITENGLALSQGTALVSVPEEASDRFRLHFPERDIAVEPGTQLAVLVESPDNYAVDGAPAPLVMVVEDQETAGGFALARGKNGVGPLFARYVYSLDKYVTPDLPGRALCDVECADLEKMFKTQTLQQEAPMATFAGGFSGDRLRRQTTTVSTPVGFTKKGERWVANTYNNEKTTPIRYLSDDYFGLANERRDLARGLALGSEVVIDGGDGTFYEIHK